MKPYTFLKHDDSSRAPALDLLEFENDSAAMDHARRLLDGGASYRCIEICDGERQPTVVEQAPGRAQDASA